MSEQAERGHLAKLNLTTAEPTFLYTHSVTVSFSIKKIRLIFFVYFTQLNSDPYYKQKCLT